MCVERHRTIAGVQVSELEAAAARLQAENDALTAAAAEAAEATAALQKQVRLCPSRFLHRTTIAMLFEAASTVVHCRVPGFAL